MKNLHYAGLSDEQLICEFLNGDNNCFEFLYNRYYSKVYYRCYSFSKNSDDAFDMTQDILLKAIRNVRSFAGNSKFSTWMYSISTNYCISQTNKRNRLNHEDIKLANQIPEERIEAEEYEERVRWEALELKLDEYLMMLGEEDRQMLVLKYHNKYSIKDLQNEFDLSASAVKMRLLRARSKMSQMITLKNSA